MTTGGLTWIWERNHQHLILNNMNDKLFISPNGKLYIEYTFFIKAYMEIEGISITELWGDAYQLNKKEEAVLFPADMCSPFPFPVLEHKESENSFIEKGGGFRLDFLTNR